MSRSSSGGQADLVQELGPARIGVEAREPGIRSERADPLVVQREGALEPFERLVGLAASRVGQGVLDAPFLAFLHQPGERLVRFPAPAEEVIRDREAKTPVAGRTLLLDLG